MTMTVIVIGLVAGIGTHLLFTAITDRRSHSDTDRPSTSGLRLGFRKRLERTPIRILGLPQRSGRAAFAASAGAFTIGGSICLLIFGTPTAALAGGLLSTALPIGALRRHHERRRTVARRNWPRAIEEIRVLTVSGGRSLPQALLEVGANGPVELRPAFVAARREWALTTDFERTLAVLRSEMDDPTCDAVCETVLIAHEVGGTGVDRRLADLAEDRRQDAHYREEVRARQAGVRFARRFVLIVPLGMAIAGLSVGTGREAYRTGFGQIAVAVGLALMAVCWVWAGRMLRLPQESRSEAGA